jgi:hypothetical protein
MWYNIIRKEEYTMDYLDKIMAWESGELGNEDVLKFFAELIKSGQAWSLQGMYGRQASRFIEEGFISKDGVVDWDKYNELIFEY